MHSYPNLNLLLLAPRIEAFRSRNSRFMKSAARGVCHLALLRLDSLCGQLLSL